MNRRALPLILLGAAGLLFCFGAVALAANFIAPRSATVDLAAWKPPYEQIDAKAMDPAVALGFLAGNSDGASVDDALAAGDWESAFAHIAYGTEFSDANRVGTLLLLGSRYAAANDIPKAAWSYQYAVFLATVSPAPSDLTRAQALLEAAQGLKAIHQDATARSALDHAYLVAQYSFSTPRDTRADLLEQIGRAYAAFGEKDLAAQAQQQAAEAWLEPNESAISAARRPFRIQPTSPPENPELRAKLQERLAAARELVDALYLNPPTNESELPEQFISALGDKLYEEDGMRTEYYAAQYDQAVDASARLGVLRDKIRWLALKYRIARNGFGISLLQEWEDAAESIAQELNDAHAEYFQIVEEQAAGLEKSDEAARSVEDTLRAAIAASRWGLYPQADEEDLRLRLDEVSQALRDERVNALRLDSYKRGDQIVYLLVPDELYGQGERALPR
jgi:hypothetical protein